MKGGQGRRCGAIFLSFSLPPTDPSLFPPSAVPRNSKHPAAGVSLYRETQSALTNVKLSVHKTSPSPREAPWKRGGCPLFAGEVPFPFPFPRSISPRAIHFGAGKGGKSHWREDRRNTQRTRWRGRESLGMGGEGRNEQGRVTGSDGGVPLACHEPSSLLDGHRTGLGRLLCPFPTHPLSSCSLPRLSLHAKDGRPAMVLVDMDMKHE